MNFIHVRISSRSGGTEGKLFHIVAPEPGIGLLRDKYPSMGLRQRQLPCVETDLDTIVRKRGAPIGQVSVSRRGAPPRSWEP